MKNFIFGFTQVFLVSAQTYFIFKVEYALIAVTGFFISLLWTYNVRAALGSFIDRVLYSAGAMSGSVIGLYIAKNYLLK